METGVVGPADRISALVRDWLVGYITRPHPEIGRGGAVCPFVQPALNAGTVEMVFEHAGPDPTVGTLIRMIKDAADSFDHITWADANPTLRSLLLVIPDLPADRLSLLDEAHAAIKSEVVRQGLMIGQFHARCPEPAARNKRFPVSRSPVPLVAIRGMAFHDILFLHGDEEWFWEYVKRFGHRYSAGYRPDVNIDPAFVELFEHAALAYGRALV